MRKTAIRAEFEAGEPRTFASRAQLAKRAAQYHPLDGQLVPRSSDAGLLAAIIAGEVPSCSDADWLADKSKRGMYTLGDGTTNIRLPDWNGKSAGALGAPVIRGDGTNSAAAGVIQGDCIRELEGKVASGSADTIANVFLKSEQNNGVFIVSNDLFPTSRGERIPSGSFGSPDDGRFNTLRFKASNVVPVGSENRMVNTAGVHAVKR